ncbi:MAG: hypothetical protein ACREPW_00375 [Candidatus Binataceae bacterium]
MDEARAVTDIARRIAAILLMEPELDANYVTVKKAVLDWSSRTRTSASEISRAK